jgi:hypothetical protein
MMGDIYREAKSVQIWLGDDEDMRLKWITYYLYFRGVLNLPGKIAEMMSYKNNRPWTHGDCQAPVRRVGLFFLVNYFIHETRGK